MISLLELPFNTTAEMNGIVTKTCDAPEYNEPIQLYVPELMSGIDQSEPKTIYVKTKGDRVFINASNCCPPISGIIKGQNYITVSIENNSSWDNTTLTFDEDKQKYILEKGQKLPCHTISGKLNKLRFHTDNL